MSIGNLNMIITNFAPRVRYVLLSSTALVTEGIGVTLTLNAYGIDVANDTTVDYTIDGVANLGISLTSTIDNQHATPPENDFFGIRVAISGNHVFIGAKYDDDAIYNGKVYVVDLFSGELVSTIDNPLAYDGYSGFGMTGLDADGQYLIVGATGNGKVHIFNIMNGILLHTLDNPNPGDGDPNVKEFGAAVAISGNYVIVGAPGAGPENMETSGPTPYYSGKAYVYDVTTGSLLYTIDNPNPGTGQSYPYGDRFGYSVAISGERAIVGAPFDYDNYGYNYDGKAYIFDVITGSLLHTLGRNFVETPSTWREGSHFGRSVALDGNIAVIGSNGKADLNKNGTGTAYIYDVPTGEFMHRLVEPVLTTNGGFGASVSASGNYVIVGAPHDNWNTGGGVIYVFHAVTGLLMHSIESPVALSQLRFGYSTGISGNYITAGAWYLGSDGGDAQIAANNPSEGDNAGKAYIFNIMDDITTPLSGQFSLTDNSTQLPITSNENDDTMIFVLGDTGLGAKTVKRYSTNRKLSFTVLQETYNEIEGSDNSGMFFKPDSSKMWLQDTTNDEFREYSLTAAPDIDQWKLSTIDSTVTTGSYGTTGGNHQGMWMNDTGTILFQVDSDIQTILQDDISAWEPVGRGTPSRTLDISADTSAPSGIAVNSEGTKAFVSSLSPTVILEYSGAANQCNAWTLSHTLTLGFTASDVFVDIKLGTKMYISDDSGKVHMYKLPSPWDLSTAEFMTTLDLTSTFNNIYSVYVVEPDSKLFRITLDATDSIGNRSRPTPEIVTIENKALPEEVFYGNLPAVWSSQYEEEYTLKVPAGITEVSAIVVGGGGSGAGGVNKGNTTNSTTGGGGGEGGALAYGTFSVTPGEILYIQTGSGGGAVDPAGGGSAKGKRGYQGGTSFIKRTSFAGTTLLQATGGKGGTVYGVTYSAPPSAFSGTEVIGGGLGGAGGDHAEQEFGVRDAGGGGGAGGYSGNGGYGAGYGTSPTTPAAGSGGGGAGGQRGTGGQSPHAGGGVGIIAEGASGVVGNSTKNGSSGPIFAGGGGDGGQGWSSSSYDAYGDNSTAGGSGAVRIIWGNINNTREYPSTNTGNFLT
jgi:hypothetical protein